MIKLGWLNIYDIYKLHVQTIAFDVGTENTSLNITFSNLYKINNLSKMFLEKNLGLPHLKKNDFLITNKQRTKKFGKNSLSVRVSKHWNSFPDSLRQPMKTNIFKKKQKLSILYNPTLYRKYTQTDIDDLTDCIAEARIIKKYFK